MGGMTTTELRRIFGPLTLREGLILLCFESSDDLPLLGSLNIKIYSFYILILMFEIRFKTAINLKTETY